MTNNYQNRKITYDAYSDFLYKELDKAQDNFIMGRKVGKELPLWNMFFLLMQMRNEQGTTTCPTQEEVDCMSDKLFCYGINTTEMEQLWPSNCADQPDEPATGFDGIDFMQIEGDGIDHPRFRINEDTI